MSDSCTFCLIAAHRADAALVFENSDVVAFMDARPIRPGHVLVVPRVHSPDLFDLDGSVHARVFAAARDLGRAIRQAFNPKRLGMVVAGFDVPHAHVHLIPMAEYHDITSRRLLDGTLGVASIAELQVASARIKHELRRSGHDS
ncbi:MAG: HIT family protein [Myxococcales bacterium]|nr:HIT family protein [Myxococcales bacterium]